LAALAVACGSSLPPPNAQLAESRESLSRAEGAAEALGGEEKSPDAFLHLKMARDQIQTAEALIADEEMEEAQLVLERAGADAELAETLAREAKLRNEAAQARAQIQKLKTR
jgi:hypothetical protein